MNTAGFSYKGRETRIETEMCTYRSQITQERGGISAQNGGKHMRLIFHENRKIYFNLVLLFVLVIDMRN